MLKQYYLRVVSSLTAALITFCLLPVGIRHESFTGSCKPTTTAVTDCGSSVETTEDSKLFIQVLFEEDTLLSTEAGRLLIRNALLALIVGGAAFASFPKVKAIRKKRRKRTTQA